MFRFSPKRSLFVRLLSSLGPPPPPPRRHFSKLSESGGPHSAGAVHHQGAGKHQHPHGDKRGAAAVAVRGARRTME
jgi:hypothetical protein